MLSKLTCSARKVIGLTVFVGGAALAGSAMVANGQGVNRPYSYNFECHSNWCNTSQQICCVEDCCKQE